MKKIADKKFCFKRILKILLCAIAISVSLLTFTGCNLFNEKDFTSGDFIYETREKNGEKYANLIGLSEQGRDKAVLVIPKQIDGLKITAIEDSNPFFPNSDIGKSFASSRLSKLYFEYATISCIQDCTFRDCSSLRQIFVVNFREENTDWVEDVRNTLEPDEYENIKRTVYMFKDAYNLLPSNVHDNYENEKDRFFKPANVTYYYNYFGSENGGCYWIDNVQVGEKIDYIPKDPVRISDGGVYKTFGGWYNDKECTDKWNFDTDVMPDSGELNLYAKWILNK